MKIDGSVLFMVVLLTFTLGFGLGLGFATATKQKEAIQRGFAEYNSTNGVWQWKSR